MAMTVLMKQTRQGDAGAVLSAGSTYTVTEALALSWLNGFATDVSAAPDIDLMCRQKLTESPGISLVLFEAKHKPKERPVSKPKRVCMANHVRRVLLATCNVPTMHVLGAGSKV